jgi:FKBP-type peptidyl-prolyl cis-trans isomerase
LVGIEYGLLGMRVGGKRSILVPPNPTYHERKTYREIPEDAMLIYELRLVDLSEKWDAEMESRLANPVGN